MASEYQRLATLDVDDQDQYGEGEEEEVDTNAVPRPQPPAGHRQLKTRLFSLRSVIALGTALILVALAFFKFGQWSASSDKNPQEMYQDGYGQTGPLGQGKVNVAYFVNWGIYGRKYPPSLIPAHDVTHILYAFANINPGSGEVVMSDKWADQDIHYPGDSWDETGNNLYGVMKQLYLLKKQNRHLKVLLSIGGWTYSPSFHPVVVNPRLREAFVRSSIKILEDYGFDGLDIDYEYPSNPEQARGYVDLLRELRHGLDHHARQKGGRYRYPLTIAAPCGPDNYQKLYAREMDQYLTFWNLMAYDFSGSWDSIANHQANVHNGPVSGSQAVTWYLQQGIPAHKLVIGIPIYGRSFTNTDGPGTAFNGIGPGTWEKGTYDYRALPLPGSHVLHDRHSMASWSYNPQTREMISFDDEEVARWKTQWINERGLGGAMFWELSGDKWGDREGMERGPGKDPQPGGSLVNIVRHGLGHLDATSNNLDYSHSQFENLRKGM